MEVRWHQRKLGSLCEWLTVGGIRGLTHILYCRTPNSCIGVVVRVCDLPVNLWMYLRLILQPSSFARLLNGCHLASPTSWL